MSIRRLLLIGAFLLGTTFLSVPVAAQAHGGPFDLAVSSDGVGGLVVTASYSGDGHPVSGIMDPVATATSSEGEVVGPVKLISSSEGEGVWVSEAPFIAVGVWSVTVSTTIPEPASVTAELEVTELAAPIEPQPAEAIGANEARGGADVDASGWLAATGAIVLIGAAAIWVTFRMRAASSRRPERE